MTPEELDKEYGWIATVVGAFFGALALAAVIGFVIDVVIGAAR